MTSPITRCPSHQDIRINNSTQLNTRTHLEITPPPPPPPSPFSHAFPRRPHPSPPHPHVALDLPHHPPPSAPPLPLIRSGRSCRCSCGRTRSSCPATGPPDGRGPAGWSARRVERPPARSSVVPPPSISSSMAPFDQMSEGRRRRIEGSVIGRDIDIDVDFIAFVQFESADDDDLVGFPSDDDIDGAVGCLGADGDSSTGRTTTLMGGCTWGELSNGHGTRPPRQSGRAVGRVRGIPGEDPRGERRRRKAGAVAQQSRRRRRLLDR